MSTKSRITKILVSAATISLLSFPAMAGYGPGDGTGSGSRPQDGSGNGAGKGDCESLIQSNQDGNLIARSGNGATFRQKTSDGNGSAYRMRNAGSYGPGDGTGTGTRPMDGSGNGAKKGTCTKS